MLAFCMQQYILIREHTCNLFVNENVTEENKGQMCEFSNHLGGYLYDISEQWRFINIK